MTSLTASLRLIQILDKAHNAIRLVEFNNLRSLPPLVLKTMVSWDSDKQFHEGGFLLHPL